MEPTLSVGSLSKRHQRLTLDPDKFAGKSRRGFTPEQVAECRELFQIFDKRPSCFRVQTPMRVCFCGSGLWDSRDPCLAYSILLCQDDVFLEGGWHRRVGGGALT